MASQQRNKMDEQSLFLLESIAADYQEMQNILIKGKADIEVIELTLRKKKLLQDLVTYIKG